eukprot:6889986-Pyramimonas_sp.AAC.1
MCIRDRCAKRRGKAGDLLHCRERWKSDACAPGAQVRRTVGNMRSFYCEGLAAGAADPEDGEDENQGEGEQDEEEEE